MAHDYTWQKNERRVVPHDDKKDARKRRKVVAQPDPDRLDDPLIAPVAGSVVDTPAPAPERWRELIGPRGAVPPALELRPAPAGSRAAALAQQAGGTAAYGGTHGQTRLRDLSHVRGFDPYGDLMRAGRGGRTPAPNPMATMAGAAGVEAATRALYANQGSISRAASPSGRALAALERAQQSPDEQRQSAERRRLEHRAMTGNRREAGRAIRMLERLDEREAARDETSRQRLAERRIAATEARNRLTEGRYQNLAENSPHYALEVANEIMLAKGIEFETPGKKAAAIRALLTENLPPDIDQALRGMIANLDQLEAERQARIDEQEN